MTAAERVLAYFEQISEAPDAISRLRGFVLDLAVRGKLVDQNPHDESSVQLLERIRAEKAKRNDVSGAKARSLSVRERQDSDQSLALPSGWCWSSLSQVGYTSPRNVASDDHLASFVPMTLISADYGISSRHEARLWGELKSGYTHFANGDVALAKITPCFENGKSTVFRNLSGGIGAGTTELHVVRPVLVNPDFILIFLKSPSFIERGIPRMTGTAGQKRVPSDYFAQSPLPLPPLAEQGRIVRSVDELMALCDRLEVAQKERENRRDRLVSASLARLNQSPDPPAFQDNARFHLRHLQRMMLRADQIDRTRQAILDLAIRGRLVRRTVGELPASDIVDYIMRRRATLYKERTVPKPRPLPALSADEKAFPIPKEWAWVRLGDLCYQVSDGPHFSPQYVNAAEGVPFLSTRNVRKNGFDLSALKYVSKADHEAFCKRIRPEKGDIIYTKGGTTGIARVNDLDFDFSVWVHLAVLRIEKKQLFPRFVELALNSSHCYQQSQRYTQGISNFDLGLTRMIKITLPLPPLAEQYQIVAKADELLAVCDRLEAQLSVAETERRRLLESVLQQTLAPPFMKRPPSSQVI